MERLLSEDVALSRGVPQPAIVYCTSSMAVAVLSVKGFLSVFEVYAHHMLLRITTSSGTD
jgi:hypothetical protein